MKVVSRDQLSTSEIAIHNRKSRSSPRFMACAGGVPRKNYSSCKRIASALALSVCVVAAAGQSDSQPFVKFKSEMMPKVGHKITVVGTLSEGKEGFWLAFNNWGVYIHPVNGSGNAKQNDLYAHFRSGQTVRVTGTLRHFAPPATRKEDQHARVAVQLRPEEFFFDAAEAKMSRWSPGP